MSWASMLLMLLLSLALCALVFCAGILVGWWYVHHVSPEVWELVKAASIPADRTEEITHEDQSPAP